MSSRTRSTAADGTPVGPRTSSGSVTSSASATWATPSAGGQPSIPAGAGAAAEPQMAQLDSER